MKSPSARNSTSFPVARAAGSVSPALIRTPEASAEEERTTASIAASCPVKLREADDVKSKSSPAAAPVEVISIPPLVEVKTIPSAAPSEEVKLMDDPVANISIYYPRAAAEAQMSIPPTLD